MAKNKGQREKQRSTKNYNTERSGNTNSIENRGWTQKGRQFLLTSGTWTC